MAVSHIMLEAYKKLILVALILQGKVCRYHLGRAFKNVIPLHAELIISPYPATTLCPENVCLLSLLHVFKGS